MKETQISVLTATYVEEGGGYTGWLNEDRGVISQGDTLEEMIQGLKDCYWIKHCQEHKKK